MGYSHEMVAEISAHPGVTVEALDKALKPLTDYWGFDSLIEYEGSSGSGPMGETWTFQRTKNEQGLDCLRLHLWTEGSVGYGYADLVKQCAENLSGLCVADHFTLIDFDAPPDEATQRIWFGDPQEVKIAERKLAWELAKHKLSDGGYSEEEIKEIGAAVQNVDAARESEQSDAKPRSPASRPAG